MNFACASAAAVAPAPAAVAVNEREYQNEREDEEEEARIVQHSSGGFCSVNFILAQLQAEHKPG